MHVQDMRCDDLIETTAAALNEDTVGLMLLAVQRNNLGSCVKTALNRVHSRTGTEVKHTVRECLTSFPYIWVSVDRVLACGTWPMMLDAAATPSW
ncbi:hypothetical protein EDB84DRAFT_1424443 [Lactarius hengduanensis]|nr:hypothetical protein EDB84DRAFT_1424443 [Lactarius hengduanensis]